MSEALSNAPKPPAPLSTASVLEYLDYAMDALLDRRDVLIGALRVWADTTPQIDDDVTLRAVAENARMVAALHRTAEDRRAENKRPFLDGGRAVDGWFREFSQPLDSAMVSVQHLMDEYGARKLTRERAAADAARRLATEEADRAAALAARALDQGEPAAAAALLERAAKTAEAAAEADARAAASAVEMTRVRGMFGTTAAVRETWSFEITDAAAVPREYLVINSDAIKAASKRRDTSGRPLAVIPGVEWVSSTRVAVRG